MLLFLDNQSMLLNLHSLFMIGAFRSTTGYSSFHHISGVVNSEKTKNILVYFSNELFNKLLSFSKPEINYSQ